MLSYAYQQGRVLISDRRNPILNSFLKRGYFTSTDAITSQTDDFFFAVGISSRHNFESQSVADMQQHARIEAYY